MLQIHVNICETAQLLQDLISAFEESSKKLKTSNVFLWFIVCSNQIRSALVRELLSNSSLSVGCRKIYQLRCALVIISLLQPTSKQ